MIYLNDNYYFLFLMLAIVVMFGGVVLLLGMPGTLLFLIADQIPSLFLKEISGGYISESGFRFSYFWPFLTVGAYLISKLKITKLKEVAVVGEFNVISFLALLLLGSIGLATILHLNALNQ